MLQSLTWRCRRSFIILTSINWDFFTFYRSCLQIFARGWTQALLSLAPKPWLKKHRQGRQATRLSTSSFLSLSTAKTPFLALVKYTGKWPTAPLSHSLYTCLRNKPGAPTVWMWFIVKYLTGNSKSRFLFTHIWEGKWIPWAAKHGERMWTVI